MRKSYLSNVAFKILLPVVFTCISLCKLNAQTFTIGPTGNYATFNAAYNAIKNGITAPVIFNVQPGSGPYNEQLIIKTIPGNSATNTVTFNCNGVQMGTSATTTTQRAIIKLDGASFITIDSLTIDASVGTYGYGVQLIRDADSNTISHCTIKTNTVSNSNANYGGIVINGTDAGLIATTSPTLCDYNLFLGNKITGGYYGITDVGLVSPTNGGTNGHNVFMKNIISDFYQYGIYFSGTYNSLIDSNVISRPARTAVGAFTGIYFTGSNILDTLTRNTIKQPFDGAIGSSLAFDGINFNNVQPLAGFDNLVINNIISASNGTGATNGIINTSSNSVQYYHNTISIENGAATGSNTVRGFYQTGAADGIVFYDNVVSIYRGGSGKKHCIYLTGTSTSFISDYNDLYVSANGTNNFVGFKGSDRATLALWRSNTGFDLNSVSADPVYFDTASENYKPQNAAIDGRGLYLGIDFDIYNVARNPAGPDMGAVEFVPPPCVAPPLAGTTLLNGGNTLDTTVCEGVVIPLSLTGNSFGSSQIFTWETSPNAGGPWTKLGNDLTLPDTNIVVTTTLYYRASVTCGASTVYSNTFRIIVIPRLPQGTYTINNGSPTSYPTGTNFNNFNDAKNAMSCGIRGAVVFNVAGSTPYNEQLIFDSIANVSAINTITFNGNGKTIQYSSAVAGEKAVIKLSKSRFITFNRLIIDARGTGGQGFGVQILNNSDSNTFHACTVLTDTASNSVNYAGIVINSSPTAAASTGSSFCDGNILDSNTVVGGYYGIIAVSNTSGVNNSTVITNNIVKEFYSYGIYLGPGNFNTLVEANRVTRPARYTAATTLYGIYVKGNGSATIIISKNRIYDLLGGNTTATNVTTNGITHDDADGNTGSAHIVVNNLLFKFSGSGAVNGILNIGTTNVNYYHNTIAIENLGGNPTGTSRGFSQTGVSTGSVFKNNMVTIDRGGTGTKHVIYLTTSANVESNFNDLFIGSTDGNANYLGYNGANRIDLGAWQNNTSPKEDSNSYSYDPGYVNPALEDYRPVVAPIDDKGTPVGIATDILNNPRSTTTPDIGAFEFSVPPCGAPTSTNATVTPNAGICVAVPIILDLPGAVSAAGLIYVWQNSPDGIGNWTNISDTLYFPKFNTLSLPDHFYRVQIICSGTVYYSTVVSINMNLLLVGGSYTINKNQPTNYIGVAGANFNSYTDAVAAMNCGITGPIVFNVSADTYTEQVFIHKVPGLGIVNAFGRNTVVFQSANAATSVLTYSPAIATANYTLKIDSASYVTFRNLSIANTSATNGRVVEFSGNSGYDNLLNCIIITSATTNTAKTFAAVYAFSISNLTIKGNTISNGSAGIYLEATTANNSINTLVDSNTVSGGYNYGIYNSYSKRIRVTNNTVNVSSPISATAYGIYTTNCDTAYRILRNTTNITNVTAGSVNGIYTTNCNAPLADSGIVASNTVLGGAGNTGKIFGLVNNTSSGLYTINNVVAITTAGNASYGLHSVNTNNVAYYNNSVNMSVPGDSLNYAAYFNHTAATGNVKIRNNIFSNKGIGRAFFINNPTYFFSDYNDLYTGGVILAQVGTPAVKYQSITPIRQNIAWEINSIVFAPAFVSNTDLHPDITNADVWAIHGRGTQVRENSYDFNNNPRPTTLPAGVPDLGAYEFHPTVDPTILTAIPNATPVAGQTQIFMYGSDTVMKIKWDSFAVVPPAISLKRFSGDAPPGLPATYDSMYFYTRVEIPGGSATNYKCTVQQFFIDPWQGTIQNQRSIAMGRTVPSHAWYIDINSKVDASRNVITDTSLTFLDKFTGLVNPYYIELPDNDNSNRGKHFWCAYPINELDGASNQQMVIYLSAEQDANVEVRIDAINWVKTYFVPANTVKVSDVIPLTAFVNTPGQSNLGININSFDNPVVAYTHITGSASSGAGMLMPVGVWGYEYQTLSIESLWGADAFTYYYVIADHDNTQVEITSVAGTALQNTGITPGTPFTITLNKGDFYQVVAQSDDDDLSGSVIKSVPGTDGKCYPVAVFCGSGRAAIGCPPDVGGSGDFVMQQVFPYQAWGKRYITTPTSASTGANVLQPNVFRVAVRDPLTIVKRNGVVLTGLNNRYYQFVSSTADYIEANKPIMVAQFITDACTGNGDPEMIYISPIEQGINNIGFYRNTVEDIDVNLLTLVVPTNAVSSTLGYEGINTFPTPNFWSYTYPHPQNGQAFFRGVNYTILVKRWGTSAQQQVRISSDSAFTAITYGLGLVESYGYNAGTLVKNLSLIPDPGTNHGDSIIASEHTCAGTPYSISFLLPVKPDSLKIQWSASPAIPNNDLNFIAPVPTGIVVVNTDTFYRFVFTDLHTFPAAGAYTIPIQYSHPSFEGCNKTKQDKIVIQVFPEPRADFSVTSPVCEGDTTFFKADSTTANGLVISKWVWKFHDGSIIINNTSPYKIYPAGTYTDTLKVTTPDGCIGDTTKQVVVTVRPTVDVIQDSITVCPDSSATFIIQNPIVGATYNWYDSANGVIPIATGDTFVVANVTAIKSYYVEVIYGCNGLQRKQVTVLIQPGLAKPQPVATAGAADITWTWPAVPGAVGYQIQVAGTGVWTDPGSGPLGLTHTITGLVPQQSVCLLVRVLGATACLNNISDTVCATVGCPNVTISVTPQNDSVCAGQQVTFTAAASQSGLSFSWYDSQTGGTLLSSANPYTVTTPATDTVYVEGSLPGCTYNRVQAVVTVFNQLAQPVFSASNPVTDNSITFNWNAVTGATSYEVEVSTNPGTWITPSSGPTGLSHLVGGLSPRQAITLQVRALGTLSCQTSIATSQSDTTLCNNLTIAAVRDTVRNCTGLLDSLEVTNPQSTYTYTWVNIISGYTITGPKVYITVGTTDSVYTVQATSGVSCISNIVTVVVRPSAPLAPPAGLTGVPALTSIVFSWASVAGATGYQVSTDGVNYTPVGNVLTYTLTPLTPGQSVTFYVRAVNGAACLTSIPATVNASALPCPVLLTPIVTVSDSTQTSVTFVWNAVANATGYTVVVNGNSTSLPAGTTTYVVSGLTPSQSVTISVTAISVTPCPSSGPGLDTGTAAGCTPLPAPVTVSFVDSSSNFATFSWTAISGASGYKVEVSINGQSFSVFAANVQGTSISITGLSPADAVVIRVTTLGGLACENSLTATPGKGRAAIDQVYIPNTFLPNSGVAANRRLGVYSNIIKDGKFLIFNQWGQKIYEATTIADMKTGWDGTYSGKAQPVGVYIYVGKFTLTNGSVIEKKGSINLVR